MNTHDLSSTYRKYETRLRFHFQRRSREVRDISSLLVQDRDLTSGANLPKQFVVAGERKLKITIGNRY